MSCRGRRWRSLILTGLEDLALWWLRRQGMDLAVIGYRWGAYAVVAWGPTDVQARQACLTDAQAVEFLWSSEAAIADAMQAAGAVEMDRQLWAAVG